MATTAELQERMRKSLEDSAHQFRSFTDDQIGYAIDQISATRNEIYDKLEKYSLDDDSFPKKRLMALLNDLNDLEMRVFDNGMDTMETIIKDTAEFVSNSRHRAMTKILGTQGDTGVEFDRIPDNVLRAVITRTGADGMVLSDRVWQLAGDLHDQLASTVRSGVLQGKGLKNMIADVRKVYANETWKIRRMVLTESAIAHRTADSYVAQQSEMVKGLRIHKGEADRPNHMCSILAAQDKYGLGTGVFLPTDTAILNPHPNCTSWLEYVINEKKVDSAKKAQEKLGEPAPSLDDPDADPIAVLNSLTSRKDVEKWMIEKIGMDDANLKDFDLEVMQEVGGALHDLKTRFPEAAQQKLHTIGTLQYQKSMKYEHRIAMTIDSNRDVKHWRTIREEHGEEEMRAQFRDYLIKKNVVKRETVERGSVALATNYGERGEHLKDGIFINAAITKDPQKFKDSLKRLGEVDWITTPTIRGTVAHEYGHLVHYQLHDAGRTKFIDDLWAQWKDQDQSFWESQISRYAAQDEYELFAELFAEYVEKPSTMRPAAQHFGQQLERELAAMRGLNK